MEIRTWPDGEDPYAMARGLLPERGTLGATDRMWAAQLISLQRAVPDATFVPASLAAEYGSRSPLGVAVFGRWRPK